MTPPAARKPCSTPCAPPSAQPNVLTDGDLSACEQDWRTPLARPRPGRGAAGQHGRSRRGRARLRGARRSHRRPGRQHRPGRRQRARRQRHAGAAEPRPHEPRARHRHRQPHDDAGRRLRAPGGPGSGCRAGPAAALEPRGRRQLHDRRQPRHQRRRHPGPALRQCARAVPRARGGHGRRATCGTAWRACARTTPATTCATSSSAAKARSASSPAPRCGCTRSRPRRSPRWRPAPRWTPAWRCWRARRPRLGAGLTGFEVMNDVSLALVAKHFPQLKQPLAAVALDGAARAERRRERGACARPVRGAARKRAGSRDHHRRRGGRERGAIARAVAPARKHPAGAERGRPEHQARHRAAGVAHPGLRRGHRRGAAARLPGRAHGRLRPPRRRQPALQRAGARRRATALRSCASTSMR